MTLNQDEINALRKKIKRQLAQNSSMGEVEYLFQLIQEVHENQTKLKQQTENLRKTQQSLERSKRLYFSLFDLAPVGILRLDRRLMVLEANQSALHQLGSKKLLVGHPFMGLVDDAHQSSCRNHFANAAYHKRRAQGEFVLYSNSGDGQNTQLYTTFLSLDHGGQESYLTVLVDTTQQQKDRADLKIAATKLEEVNTTIKVLLEEREEEIGKVKEAIAVNIARFIMPMLSELAKSGLSKDQQVILDALRVSMDKMTSGQALKLTSAAYGLSHRELEVANLIRDGLTSDEISNILNISSSCVLFHRNKIRRKLGLVGKKKRLAEYLLQLG